MYSYITSYGQYLPKGSVPNTNVYGQTPCVSLAYNAKLNSLYGIMYYTQSTSTAKPKFQTQQDAWVSSVIVGDSASVYEPDTPMIMGIGWYLYESDPLLANAPSCQPGGIMAKHSLIINLEYIGGKHALGARSIKESDQNLLRVQDPDSDMYPLGDKRNKNTLSADIALANEALDASGNHTVQYHGIIFGSPKGPIITSAANHQAYVERGIADDGNDESNTVAVIGAGMAAGSFMPNERKQIDAVCSAKQQGTITRQTIPSPYEARSNLVCTYNPWACNLNNTLPLHNYCYVRYPYNCTIVK